MVDRYDPSVGVVDDLSFQAACRYCDALQYELTAGDHSQREIDRLADLLAAAECQAESWSDREVRRA